MAKSDLFGRLADLSEDAIQRLSEAPGADRLVGAMNTMRDRIDDLQKRVRGLEDLEKRLAALEKRVDDLGGESSSSSTGSAGSTKTTSTKSSGGSTAKKS